MGSGETRAFVLLLALRAASAAAENAPQPQNLDDLRKAVQDVLTKSNVPGAGIALVSRGGATWAGGVGKADVAAGKDVTADTIFCAGSVSKTFVALALVKLAEEGKLDLNARLKDVAPEIEFRNRWESGAPVRIVNLLEHTAGFDDMHFNEMFNTKGPPDLPLREVMAINPHSRSVLWPPGTCMSYSNPGYTVAGYVIEKITGKAYDEYIRQAILNPLGMNSAGFRLDKDSRANLARGYKDATGKPVPFREIYLRPSGSLNVSPRDLASLVQMFLSRGKIGVAQIVKPESIARMEEARTSLGARAGLKTEYGLGIQHQLDGPVTFLGHTGGFEGFAANYAYSPSVGVGYAFLLNSSGSPRAWRQIRDLVSTYVLREATLPERPAAKLTEEQLRRFVGYYQPVVSRDQLAGLLELVGGGRSVFVKNGVLYQQAFRAEPEALTPVSQETFRLGNESDASMIFLQREEGSMVLTGSESYLQRVNPFLPRLRLFFLLACLVLMLSSLLFAPVWFVRKVFGKMVGVLHLKVRIIPLCAVLSLVAVPFLLRRTPLAELGSLNFRTAAICGLTWVFALLTFWGVWLSVRSFSFQMNRLVRIHSLLVSLANFGMLVFLAYWHLIGLRTWVW